MGKETIKKNIAKHRAALEKMALDIWAKPEAGFRPSSPNTAAATRSSVSSVSSMRCPA